MYSSSLLPTDVDPLLGTFSHQTVLGLPRDATARCPLTAVDNNTLQEQQIKHPTRTGSAVCMETLMLIFCVVSVCSGVAVGVVVLAGLAGIAAM
jgi:hypothetical protein